MPFATRHHAVKLITVAEFVEEVGALFDLGTQQADKITLARSFSKKQDRYSLLDGEEAAPLIEALAGISVRRGAEPSDDARNVLRAFFAHTQQLVSWIQASLVHDAADQEDLNIAVTELFGTPQLATLIYALFESDVLEDYSPLKQLPICVKELTRQDYDPIKACKELMRSRIQERLDGRAPVTLLFFKHLNSLDPRSSTRPATQRRELTALRDELNAILGKANADLLIDELTGIYAAMMALKQLHRRMSETQPQYFPALIRQLNKDMQSIMERDTSRRLSANRDLFVFFMHAGNMRRLTATISNTSAFKSLLEGHRTFASSGLPNLLRDFLRNGLTKTWNRTKLIKALKQLQRCSDKPFHDGVAAFLLGVLAISEQDPAAQLHFAQCLQAAEQWALGPFHSQAALFALGLKLALEPSPSPNALNPLLSSYLENIPQYTTIHLEGSSSESTEIYNLHEAIAEYNEYCWTLTGHKNALIVNPFKKIEEYLRKIFDEIGQRNWPVTAESLKLVTFDVTTKRDVERVKSEIYGTSLHQWLTKKFIEEIFRSFRHPGMLEILPAINRYVNLPESMRDAIASASDPRSAGAAP
ncbi:hypothetical protein [Massilia aerilata]|uniref:Uncharacterized protein n=1 Tax=Massilia aerilata TaxID=453817 RepID=A0ABW0RZJ8_9BURK